MFTNSPVSGIWGRWLVAAVTVGACVALPPAAAAAEAQTGFGIQAGSFRASACGHELEPSEIDEAPLTAECAPPAIFTQAAGHPTWLAVSLAMNSSEAEPGSRTPVGTLKSLRLDLPPGLSFDPETVPRCSIVQFESRQCAPNSEVGESLARISLSPTGSVLQRSAVFNLEPAAGLPAELGIDSPVQIYLAGGFSWHHEAAPQGPASGDYHEYAIASRKPAGNEGIEGLQLLEQLLIFSGSSLQQGFITMPSACSQQLAYHIAVESSEHQQSVEGTETPGGIQGCMGESPLIEPTFEPAVELEPSTAVSDTPDGVTLAVKASASSAPNGAEPTELDRADPHEVTFRLPEGMTLDPSAASELAACTRQQFGIAANGAGGFEEHPLVAEESPISCPAASRIGTFTVRSPDLPEEVCKTAGATHEECPAESDREATPLTGSVYIGQPLSDSAESGEEYRLFLAAESARLGVALRVLGEIKANTTTGRLEATIEMPQLPFEEALVQLEGGASALLANPLACAPSEIEGHLVAYGEQFMGTIFPAPADSAWPYADFGCPFSPRFEPEQSTTVSPSPPVARAGGSFTLSLTRSEGQSYLAQMRAVLPEGLIGDVASLPVLCTSAQASADECPPGSELGRVAVTAGAGSRPAALTGSVYLTGPYEGAPYGLAIEIDAHNVGPYDLGEIAARARIEVDPHSADVIIATPPAGAPGSIPEIVDGVPLRLRSLSVTLARPGFIHNPTSCGELATHTTLTGTDVLPAVTSASWTDLSALRVTGCEALPFEPAVKAVTAAKSSVKGGARVQVSITGPPGNANFKEVAVALPKQLVTRLSVLQHACAQAQVSADISACPARARVGQATVTTPMLPSPLSGPAILISRGKHALDALAFVLEGDGVSLIIESHAEIKHGTAYWVFSALPDAPIANFQATFPAGPSSLLIAGTGFCHRTVTTRKGRRTVPVKLLAPTTVVAQNGKAIQRAITVAVTGCARRRAR
jgi:hypothetical protein